MASIHVDLWLYGQLARYAGEAKQGSFANLKISLPESSTIRDLLDRIQMPTEARGISFVNGELSAMPGLQPDLGHILQDGDRVAFFDQHSMWPFQYRSGVAMVAEMSQAMHSSQDQGLHHRYES
jgi:hypothetical protein